MPCIRGVCFFAVLQVVLKACAGMDLWEFAQFCVLVSLPRLLQFHQLLNLCTPLGQPCLDHAFSQYCVPLTRIITMATDGHKELNFFTSGQLSQTLQEALSALMSVSRDHAHERHLPFDVSGSPDASLIASLCSLEDGHNRDTDELVSSQPGTDGLGTSDVAGPDACRWGLLSALPQCLQECVMAVPAGPKQHFYQRLLALRAFEVWTLNNVTQQLAASLPHPS